MFLNPEDTEDTQTQQSESLTRDPWQKPLYTSSASQGPRTEDLPALQQGLPTTLIE
jgi:hypothetical protein